MAKKETDKLVFIIRWLGRIVSSLMILLMLAFIFDEGLTKLLKFSSPEIILFLAFFTILAGYIVSFKKESIGAVIIIAGTIFFWSVNTVSTGKLWMGWFIFVFPLTALPLIYCWWKEK